jgi:TetR/AcrR family transcriptional repressor of nem operon
MVRPREFDRDAALGQATRVFWAKGFAATSTEDLVEAMGIGRQSLYNAFGDKRRLYLEALEAYQQQTTAGHLHRLSLPASAIAGGEIGTSDPDLVELRTRIAPVLRTRLVTRLREGQAIGEIDASIDPEEAAGFLQLTMTGLQLAARSGAAAADLRGMARFAVDRLKSP